MDVASPRRSRKYHLPCLSINFSLAWAASFNGANDIRNLMLIVRVFFFPFYSYRYGATGVWVGTRFVASTEAGAPKIHKDLVVSAGFDDTIKTIIYTGRPLHIRKNDYVVNWCATSSLRRFTRLSSRRVAHPPLFPAFHREENRKDEIKKLTAEGKLPHEVELEKHPELSAKTRPCTFSFLYAIQSLLLNNIFYRADGQGCGKNRRE